MTRQGRMAELADAAVARACSVVVVDDRLALSRLLLLLLLLSLFLSVFVGVCVCVFVCHEF